jgi:hypothetical protein
MVPDPVSALMPDHPWHSDRVRELDRLLEQSEPQFGSRIEGWDFRGVILGDENRTLIHPKTTKVFISLEQRSKDDIEWAQFQLAHESIHLLGPSFSTNILEEGWASHFSLYNCLVRQDRVSHFRAVIGAMGPRYAFALALYEEFLEEGGTIRSIREVEPYVFKADGNLLKRRFPQMPDRLIENLVEPFFPKARPSI